MKTVCFVTTTIPHEVQSLIFSYIPPNELINSVSVVNQDWSKIVHDKYLWGQFKKNACDSFPEYLNLYQLQRCCVIIHYLAKLCGKEDKYNESNVPKIFCPQSILPTREFARKSLSHGRAVCLASSTDHDYEGIENVLFSREEEIDGYKKMPISTMNCYWSSKERPSEAPGTYDEELLFTTKHPDVLLHQIKIKPFSENMANERKSYTWKALKIFVYHLSLDQNKFLDMSHQRHKSYSPCFVSSGSEGVVKRNDQVQIMGSIRSHIPVYESEIHYVKDVKNPEWQNYTLPLGIIGNFIRIVLVGKCTRQDETSGFYVGVERVVAEGYPIFPNH